MAQAEGSSYQDPAMPLLIDGPGDCSHSRIEHLGNDHDARFFRCEGCGRAAAVPPRLRAGRAKARTCLGSRDVPRASDLTGCVLATAAAAAPRAACRPARASAGPAPATSPCARSEEHTSEL